MSLYEAKVIGYNLKIWCPFVQVRQLSLPDLFYAPAPIVVNMVSFQSSPFLEWLQNEIGKECIYSP